MLWPAQSWGRLMTWQLSCRQSVRISTRRKSYKKLLIKKLAVQKGVSMHDNRKLSGRKQFIRKMCTNIRDNHCYDESGFHFCLRKGFESLLEDWRGIEPKSNVRFLHSVMIYHLMLDHCGVFFPSPQSTQGSSLPGQFRVLHASWALMEMPICFSCRAWHLSILPNVSKPLMTAISICWFHQ